MLDYLANNENKVKKLVVASSMSVYGEGAYECEDCGTVYPELRTKNQLKDRNWEMRCPTCNKVVSPKPTTEDKPLKPTSTYAITKRDQEEMCLALGREYGIPTTALRYFNVYGPRQSLNNPYTGVCAIFSSRIKNNKPPLIFEDGLQLRDFISVKDIVEANVLTMKSKNADYEVFNVGTGNPVNISRVAQLLIELYNKEEELEPEIVNRYRAGDIRHCFSDNSKIKKKLNFEPRTTFEEGMKELVDWSEKVTAEDKTVKAQEELQERGLLE